MAALERDLEGVLADESNVLDTELVRVQAPDPSQASWRARLASALRAGTGPPESLSRVAAAVTIFPADDHDLPLAVDVDGKGIRVGVFQGRSYRTLMTGSCRKD